MRILIPLLIPIFIFASSLVDVEKAKIGEISKSQNFVGTLYFNKSSNLASESDGKVLEVNFERGDFVQKGETLVRIDSKVLNAQIKAIKASILEVNSDLKRAVKEFKRYKKLYKSKSITEQDYDNKFFAKEKLEAKLQALKANEQELLVLKEKKVIKAPFSGFISDKSIEIGEWAKVGGSVAKLLDSSEADVMFNIQTELFKAVKKGDSVVVKLGDREYLSKVHSKILVGDKLTRTFPMKVKVKVDDNSIYEGMSAKVSIASGKKRKAILLSRDSVIERFGQSVVFSVNDGVATMLPVEVIGFDGMQVAVQNPMLKEGSLVVVKGNERIFPNQPVSIRGK